MFGLFKVKIQSITHTIKNIQNFADKEKCRSFRDGITSGKKLGFEVEFERGDLVLEEDRTFTFG